MVLLGALGMITLLAAGARTRPVPPVTRVPVPSSTDLGHRTPPQPSPEMSGTAFEPPITPGRPSPMTAMIENILQTVLIITAVLAVLVIIVLVVRAVSARQAPPGIEDLGEDAVDLAHVGRHLAASRGEMAISGDIRAAIVAWWEGLEQVVGEAGRTSRAPYETASEFVTRVLATGDLSPSWTIELADLYERALFSAEDLTEADRERALRALNALTDEIDRAATGSGPSASAAAPIDGRADR
ncbi:MAG: DUF4129 domain-containing protein [Propionibacteriales bacterium]|nr:DUF4129 domain-containing protein [Propionibacteriales bacterium]